MPSQQPSDLQGHGREPEYDQKGNESTPKFGARKADGPPGRRRYKQSQPPRDGRALTSATGESTAAPFTYAL